jgi:hypothetical protein
LPSNRALRLQQAERAAAEQVTTGIAAD